MSNELRDTLRFLQQENVRLLKENNDLQREVVMLREAMDALRALHEISGSISADTDAMKLLDRILQSALVSISASDGSLLLVDNETQELVFVVVYGEVRDSLMGFRMPIGTGIAGWVAQNVEPVIIQDVRHDPRFSEQVDRNFQFQTQSMLCVPINSGPKVLGVIQALNKTSGKEFNRADLAILGVAAQLAFTAITKAEDTILASEQG